MEYRYTPHTTTIGRIVKEHESSELFSPTDSNIHSDKSSTQRIMKIYGPTDEAENWCEKRQNKRLRRQSEYG